jgi:azurin/glucose/arabinose dehydrogenase
MKINHISLFLLLLAAHAGLGQSLQPREEDYYKIITLPVPEGMLPEIGGLATLPNGDLAAATRRGEVWIIENPYMEDRGTPHFRRFASGLHEALGLAWRNDTCYVAQRGELTRLLDRDGDGRAERYETVYAWPISGHYHEYSFGPVIAPDGSLFVTGNVAFGSQEWWRGESRVPWRGWTMRITPDGQMEPWATGMRSPCSLGFYDGKFFYGDNQGDWMGSGFLTVVEKGEFTGHPAGLRWSSLPESPVKVRSEDIYALADPRFSPPGQPTKPENLENETPMPLFELAKKVPGVRSPSIWLPHGILGISTSQFLEDQTGGAFGPFAGQVFIGDQGQSKIDRVFIEKVNGVYQGAAFPFREGFQAGILRLSWGKDGSLFAGQTNRGWGSLGPRNEGIQRLVWTGKMPFEMKAVRAMPDGFEIEFTQPVDKQSAADLTSYEITRFIYKYHPVYGSPVVNDSLLEIWGAVVSEDGLRVRLVVDGITEGYVHEIKAPGLRSYAQRQPLLHATGYYTLNAIPSGPKLGLSRPAKPVPAPAADSHEGHAMPAPAAEAPAAPKPAAPAKLGKRNTRMPADWEKVDQSLLVGTVPGLKYDKTYLAVKAGSKLRLTFRNNDDMPHNLVIVKPGSADRVAQQALDLGLKGEAQSYVPNAADVLFHTRLIGPGASETIYFVAPSQPGVYTYVCTFPGHGQVMRGVLKVE